MKILYLITKTEIGGAQMHVRDLIKSMVADGHQVALVSFPGGWLENEAKVAGAVFHSNIYFSNSLNPLNLIRSIRRIKKIVQDFSPDLVSLHSSSAGFAGRLAIRGRIPTIFTAHSFAFTKGAPVLRRIFAVMAEKLVALYTSKIICVSNFDRQQALYYRIATPEKIVTIYNGVQEGPANIGPKEDVIVSVGRLAYPKDFALLFEGYKLANTKMRLQIIGDGPDRKNIEEKIQSLGLTDKVELFTDLSPDALRVKLAKAKVFALISKHEGLPLSILEAMSSSLPVIASNVGGIPEEVDEKCGILVANNAQEIARAITTLSKENIQEQMGKSAREKFEQHFTLDQFLEKTKKVYSGLLQQ